MFVWAPTFTAGGGPPGTFHEISRLRDEMNSNEDKFPELFGLNRAQFESFYHLLRPILDNRSIRLHDKPLRPRDEVAIYLRFLTTGKCYSYFSEYYDLPLVIVSSVVDKITELTLQRLEIQVMPPPSQLLWYRVSSGYQVRYNMPHCLGFLYARFLNVVNVGLRALLLIVSADQKFVFVDVGDYDTVPEKIWHNSTVGMQFEFWDMAVPRVYETADYERPLPYALVGGNSFPSKPFLMTKFRNAANDARKVFNCRINAVKVNAEEAVTRLRRRWQFIQCPITVSMAKVESLIKSACCLENYFSPAPM